MNMLNESLENNTKNINLDEDANVNYTQHNSIVKQCVTCILRMRVEMF